MHAGIHIYPLLYTQIHKSWKIIAGTQLLSNKKNSISVYKNVQQIAPSFPDSQKATTYKRNLLNPAQGIDEKSADFLKIGSVFAAQVYLLMILLPPSPRYRIRDMTTTMPSRFRCVYVCVCSCTSKSPCGGQMTTSNVGTCLPPCLRQISCSLLHMPRWLWASRASPVSVFYLHSSTRITDTCFHVYLLHGF